MAKRATKKPPALKPVRRPRRTAVPKEKAHEPEPEQEPVEKEPVEKEPAVEPTPEPTPESEPPPAPEPPAVPPLDPSAVRPIGSI
jgi:hypothetical protein